jgi:hypothetical protein
MALASTVTAALGLSPSSTHNAGERQGPRSEGVWKSSFWNLKSGLPNDGDDLEAHLRELVDLLGPKKPEIEQLVADGWELAWACFVSEDNGQGGVILSPQILHDLGAFPGNLWLDIYTPEPGTNPPRECSTDIGRSGQLIKAVPAR